MFDKTFLCFRYHTWRLVTSPPFENFVLLLIILNTFSLMLKYHDAPLFYVDILSYLNLLFTTLFTIEAILKVFGYGPKVSHYSRLQSGERLFPNFLEKDMWIYLKTTTQPSMTGIFLYRSLNTGSCLRGDLHWFS